MAIQCNFPTSLDSIPTDVVSGDAASVTDWNIYLDGIYKLEEKVGIDSSVDTATLDYKLKNTAVLNPGHKHSNLGLSGVPYSVTIETANTCAGTITTSAHGLGAIPTKIETSMVCITADQGWGVDDEIFVWSNYLDNALVARRVWVGADATNVIIITNATYNQSIAHKTAGTLQVAYPLSWKFRIRAGI